ncbi:13103_t:CDS:2, partial [Racocetra fulgida]
VKIHGDNSEIIVNPATEPGELDFKIWVKYGNSQPTRILLRETMDDLKEAIKKKLLPKLDDVTVDDITILRN